MWLPPPDDEVDGIRQEVRRSRRRWNGYVAQRAAYGLVAVAGVAAVLALVLALVASPMVFVAALAGIAVALLVTSWRFVAGVWRAWVGRGRAAVWVDRRAGMEGRLATLLELDERPTFFRPLLIEATAARCARFSPEEVVRSPVPGVALVAALAALGCLALAVRVAPLLEPPPLTAVPGAGAGGAPPIDGLGSLFRRMLSATASTTEHAADPGGTASGAAPGTMAAADAHAGLAGLPAALQASIRRRLWGERWAGAGNGAPGDTRARSGAGDERRGPHAGRARDTDQPELARRAAQSDDAGLAGPVGGAAGAGTGTDPDLFGPATMPEQVGEGRFALGLAARVRTVQAGPRPPSGEAPEAAPDARPTLAARQRPDAPAHRTTVPPAYAAIVREAFAHRPTEGGREP